VKETQWQLELILSEFGRAAMSTFTPLEIARGYAVAFPHMFDVIQIGGHLGAPEGLCVHRLCEPTTASLAYWCISYCSSLSSANLIWKPPQACHTSDMAVMSMQLGQAHHAASTALHMLNVCSKPREQPWIYHTVELLLPSRLMSAAASWVSTASARRPPSMS